MEQLKCRCSKLLTSTYYKNTGLYFCSQECLKQVLESYDYENNKEQITAVLEKAKIFKIRERDNDMC